MTDITTPDDNPQSRTILRGAPGLILTILALLGVLGIGAVATGNVHIGQTETQPQTGVELNAEVIEKIETPGRIHDKVQEFTYNANRSPIFGVQQSTHSYIYPSRYADHWVHFTFADGKVKQVSLSICPSLGLDVLTDAAIWDALRDWEIKNSPTDQSVEFTHDVFRDENMYVDTMIDAGETPVLQESEQAADSDNHSHVDIVINPHPTQWFTFDEAAAYMDRWFAEAMPLLPDRCGLDPYVVGA